MVNHLIQIKDVTKLFQMPGSNVFHLALRGINLEIEDSPQLISVLGPSGSGKSTLLNILSGRTPPTTGEVIFQGSTLYQQDSDKLQAYKRNIGVLKQDARDDLIDGLTLRQNLEIVMNLNHNSKSEIDENIQIILDAVGLGHRSDHFPRELSGGELQRAGLGIAVCNDPIILYADEPTGELDDDSAVEIMKYLVQLIEKLQITIIMVSHDQRIENYSDITYYLEDGMISTYKTKSSDVSAIICNIDHHGIVKLPIQLVEEYDLYGLISISPSSNEGALTIKKFGVENK